MSNITDIKGQQMVRLLYLESVSFMKGVSEVTYDLTDPEIDKITMQEVTGRIEVSFKDGSLVLINAPMLGYIKVKFIIKQSKDKLN